MAATQRRRLEPLPEFGRIGQVRYVNQADPLDYIKTYPNDDGSLTVRSTGRNFGAALIIKPRVGNEITVGVGF